MALPPKLKGARLIFPDASGATTFASDPPHTIELFLDYVCPFSAKIFKTLTTSVIPGTIHPSPTLSSSLQFIIRQQIQPWHPSSTLVHEAALAVNRLAPARFWDFSAALFDHQKEYFDVSLVGETRNQTYRRLAKLAHDAVGLGEEEVYELLAIPEKPAEDGSLNIGNAVTVDVKLVTKINRLLGVHVTPTVIFDGVVANEISSSWTGEQWAGWLGKNVV